MPRTLLDDDYSQEWPPQDKFPINNDTYQRTVKAEVLKDIKESEHYLIITGFTSLANIIEIFGASPFEKLSSLKIVLGFEPEPRRRKKWPVQSLPLEIRNYWLKENFSIMLGGPIIDIIEQIKQGRIEFRCYDKLHAKIYIGDEHAILGSANFSKNGITKQQEANIKVSKSKRGKKEAEQYVDIKTIAQNYYDKSDPYNDEAIALFKALLSEVSWQEALARAVAEIIEGEWLKEYPHLYQAIINTDLWPSQRMGVSKAMYVLQNQQNVLIADPTGSGKTKFSTTLALTLFHWFWENGRKDKSNPLIICPPQVIDNWKKEQQNIKFFNEICSMGILSVGSDKKRKEFVKSIEQASILIIDEAHNYLNKNSKRSDALASHTADHVILSTATPINKKSDDLLRLIELLDVDNLGDQELKEFKLLRNPKNRRKDAQHLDKLRNYIGQYIVRRTKKQLNRLIDQEPEKYHNAEGNLCRFPKTNCEVYETGENDNDIKIAGQISELLSKLKGVNYLRKLTRPEFPLETKEDEIKYINQRIRSAPALAGFLVRSKLRSSHCALLELLEGSEAAMDYFEFKSLKSKTGNIISKINAFKKLKPIISFDKSIVPDWLTDMSKYTLVCEEEVEIYKKIASLAKGFSGNRERAKADLLLKLMKQYKKVLAFDSTILTLDFLKKIIIEKHQKDLEVYVVTGQSEKMKETIKDKFSLGSKSQENIIALCSDAMSEGVNLQDAKAVVLLDMPSVLRIIEQRIGRLERMDSSHKEIYAYWPNDSEAFSLKGDKKLIDTLLVTEYLISNNVDFPKILYEKHLKSDVSVDNMIEAYKEYNVGDYEWEGIKDSFKPIYELIEGEKALIDAKIYEEIKKVSSSVKSRVSFVKAPLPFSFFAFRGDVSKSPKWFFIDNKDNSYTEFPEICEQLRIHIQPENIKAEHWTKETDKFLVEAVQKLKQKELSLLPNKRKRALTVARILLDKHFKKTKEIPRKQLIDNLKKLFDTSHAGEQGIVDYYHFAQNWLDILQPILNKKRKQNRRKRFVFSLNDLTDKEVPLPDDQLERLIKNCPYTETIDEKVAACIIGISV
ncbi:MAG TPA: SNF2-related protein [Bacteroidia bacterium]|jgi:superfamily II DNA or RNA helicase|nr:SNF2-related protein [Bacteroidia bacterium]